MIKAFFNETFLLKGKSEILKKFFLYDVILLKWNTCVISSNCRETTNKNIQSSKWETRMFNAILDQTKL